MKKIIPAILTQDVADLKIKLEKLKGLSDWVQIDIMDGVFVNNKSVTIKDISNIDSAKDFSLEVHLMVEDPEKYLKPCKDAGIERIIFHIEAAKNIDEILKTAEEFNLQKGIALKPNTPIEEIQSYINNLDVILLMSVEPGFQGQKFIDATLDKIRKLREMAPNVAIEVDGGINLDNIYEINNAGADYFILGSALLNSDNIKETFKELNSKIQ